MPSHRSPERHNGVLLALAVVLAGVFVLTVVAAVGVIRNTPGPTVSVAQVDLPTVSAPAQIAAAPAVSPAAVHVPVAHPLHHVTSHRHAVRHQASKHHHAHHDRHHHRHC
jgi:hypothetical protein